MILRQKNETLLAAIERKGREQSTAYVLLRGTSGDEVERDIYELVGALAGEVRYLRQRLDEVQRAAIAHAGDTEMHPNWSTNDALGILRALVNEGGGSDGK